MLVGDAQREVRTVYAGGFFGHLVSGVIWLASAALATWGSPRPAIIMLVLGGFFIFPITTAILAALRRPHSLSESNPFRYLAMQVAFVLPLSMPLVAPITIYHTAWFFPSMMVLLGAHYVPFATLYGMRSFIPLAGILILSGIALAHIAPNSFSVGGWTTGVVLVAFAIVARWEAARLRTA